MQDNSYDCFYYCARFMKLPRAARPLSDGSAKGFYPLLRNLASAILLYGFLYAALYLFQSGAANSHPLPKLQTSSENIDSDPPRGVRLDQINPHANWYNRPASTVVAVDDYLGERPDPDTIANITLLVETCRGSYEKFEKMPYLFDCLDYLANKQADYLYLPSIPSERASRSDPAQNEYSNMDHAAIANYSATLVPADKGSMGECNGPIIPYHTYWAGHATWRVEVFIKAYLYTQNLPCSRLWIWLDCDKNPDIVQYMLQQDTSFARFLPLVERGDITLKEWRFPSRIPMPPGEDNTDGIGYYWPRSESRNKMGELAIADGIIEDIEGKEWLVLSNKQKTFLPVAISDAVRFIVLHLHGGAYFDLDVLMLRDMRPLLVGPSNMHSFAERWNAHPGPTEYNTAIMSFTRNSALSSYFVRGGIRMGMNFHPKIIGRMLVQDGIHDKGIDGFQMLETAAVDPIDWTNAGRCTVPCLRDYTQVFKGRPDAFKGEWQSFEGTPLPKISQGSDADEKRVDGGVGLLTTFDSAALARMEYKIEEDNFPPTNRTLQNFFRGAWTYHIHNLWETNPEPSSWMNTIQRLHNGFFKGERMNPYGDIWAGPDLVDYELSWEHT